MKKRMKKLRIFSAPMHYHVARDMDSALVEMGHDLVKFTEWSSPSYTPIERKKEGERCKIFPRYFSPQWAEKEKPRINKKLIEEVKKAHEKRKLDLFMTEVDTRVTYPETIEEIKKLGIPTLNFAHDDIPEPHFMRVCKDLALVFDYNWTIQPGAIKSYKKIGAEVFYAPIGANPHIFKPYNCEREFDVTFIGKNKDYRKKVLQTIADEGIDIRVWGEHWNLNIIKIKIRAGYYLNVLRHSQEKLRELSDLFWSDLVWCMSDLVWCIKHFGKGRKIFGPYLSDDEMIKMYSRSKISLNFSGITTPGLHARDFDKAQKGIKGTDFDAPMSGAFYLTEYSDEIAQLYKIGKEIETFKSISELVDKIKYYLENPTEAEAIREAGRQRALRDYTWIKVFERVFNEIGLA